MTRQAFCDVPDCDRLRRHADSGYCRKHHDRASRGVALSLMTATRPGEKWLPVADEPAYLVSNMGQLWSLRTDHPVAGYSAPTGHVHVALSTDSGVKVRRQLHRLVAFAFLGDPPSPKHEVCHYDGDPRNNAVKNLRWGTRTDNLLDAVRHGTHFNASKTHCKHGHEFTPENTRTRRNGGRACVACARGGRRVA